MLFSGVSRDNDKIRRLSEYIDKSERIVATTGAGISVGGGGLTYGQLFRSTHRGGARDLENGDNSFLHTYLDSMFRYEPSLSHYALADMEKDGKLIGIITTNVDCMHTIAGSENVAEIQGSVRVNCCADCGRHYDGYEIWNQDELPVCKECGRMILPWPLYSHIGLWDRDVKKAQKWIGEADLILAIGTRGNYGSVYWSYRRNDAVIVQINPGHTVFDHAAVLNIRENCDDVFRALKERRDGK
ncbi:MAG: hypothetical protein LIO53_07430 [Oscillospiraceae bacterium]|nr:hypothetical protein [Oscillospiraceae bacterium]